MPLVDVSYDATVDNSVLRQLGELLPEVVAEAVECPEEPWTGPPGDGDIEIRFRPKGELDIGALNCVIEVRAKLFPSRMEDRQQRSDLICHRLSSLEVGKLGVWLILSEGSWSQS